MHIIAQTPRFVIRDFKPQEEDNYLALFDDERVTLHLPSRTKKEQLEIFIKTLTDYASQQVLSRWGIFNNEDGDLIGMCLMRSFYDEIGKIELGYSLHYKYWGRGIASEVAMIMIGYGFTHTEASEIVAVTTLENYGSQKVLEKAGFTRRENFHRDGEELAYFRIKR